MLEHLIGKGKDVRIYDPHMSLDSIYGSKGIPAECDPAHWTPAGERARRS